MTTLILAMIGINITAAVISAGTMMMTTAERIGDPMTRRPLRRHLRRLPTYIIASTWITFVIACVAKTGIGPISTTLGVAFTYLMICMMCNPDLIFQWLSLPGRIIENLLTETGERKENNSPASPHQTIQTRQNQPRTRKYRHSRYRS